MGLLVIVWGPFRVRERTDGTPEPESDEPRVPRGPTSSVPVTVLHTACSSCARTCSTPTADGAKRRKLKIVRRKPSAINRLVGRYGSGPTPTAPTNSLMINRLCVL